MLYFRYIEEFLKSKYILKEIGNVNTVEYLALRLSCDVSVVSEMIKKPPITFVFKELITTISPGVILDQHFSLIGSSF